MEHSPFKVLVATSGTGSRLGEITRRTNKALIEIAGRPAIGHILDAYGPGTEFVVTVGYLKGQVLERLPKLFPGRKFTFVDVDTYEGPGSSLGYSMLQAEQLLQEPFIFHACDTIVQGKDIPAPDRNWIAGYRMEGDLGQYRTIEAGEDGVITRINDKGEGISRNVLIGLFGIRDYAAYWERLRSLYEANPKDQTLNDTSPFNGLIADGHSIDLVPFPVWLDTGNSQSLRRTEESLNHHG